MACIPRHVCYPVPRVAGPNSYLCGLDSFATIAAVRTFTVLLVDIIAVPDWPRSLDSVGNCDQYLSHVCVCMLMYVCGVKTFVSVHYWDSAIVMLLFEYEWSVAKSILLSSTPLYFLQTTGQLIQKGACQKQFDTSAASFYTYKLYMLGQPAVTAWMNCVYFWREEASKRWCLTVQAVDKLSVWLTCTISLFPMRGFLEYRIVPNRWAMFECMSLCCAFIERIGD